MTSNSARSLWTPEEQKDIDRTVRALSLAAVFDWESRIDALERPGRRLIDLPTPPAALPGPSVG